MNAAVKVNKKQEQRNANSWKTFLSKKKTVLNTFNGSEEGTLGKDLSPKGSVDEALVDLITIINKHEAMYTTSSCSGRISIYVDGDKSVNKNLKSVNTTESTNLDTNSSKKTKVGGKGGGKWILVAHDIKSFPNVEDLWSTIFEDNIGNVVKNGEIGTNKIINASNRFVHFKFEPMILHIQCANFETAKSLYVTALQSGFRESGIGSNYLVGIRTNSPQLQLPIGLVYNEEEANMTKPVEAVIEKELIEKIQPTIQTDTIKTIDTDIHTNKNKYKYTPLITKNYLENLLNISSEMFEFNLGKIDKLTENLQKLTAK